MPSDSERDAGSDQSDDYFLCVPATRYARSWSCSWADVASGKLSRRDMDNLLHVNCSYLSSGTAPTLEALKQHAKCLLFLISQVATRATKAEHTGNAADDGRLFDPGDECDWVLGPLLPYRNASDSHQVPLWVIANNIVQDAEGPDGPRQRCALHDARDLAPRPFENPFARPRRSHHKLVDHANECLELLDHCHADTGGLIALLPSDKAEDGERLHEARQTLLGQWLLRTQDLVARVHALELDHLGVLDLLGSEEALAPKPADVRFALAGDDDVFGLLHRVLDKAEAHAKQHEDGGSMAGERKWMNARADEWHERGMVPVDLVSRFYRLRGQGAKSTIFIVPAMDQLPAAAASISTPTAQAKRVAELEKKCKDGREHVDRLQAAKRALLRKKAEMQRAIAVQAAELRKAKMDADFCERLVGQGEEAKCAALVAKMRAYRQKLERLKTVLPGEYHEHLSMEMEQ